MAITAQGAKHCVLCKLEVQMAEAVAFPAFIPRGHSLHKYSDCVFHRECFDAWSFADQLSDLYRRFREIWDTRPTDLESMEAIEDWGRQAFGDLFREMGTDPRPDN